MFQSVAKWSKIGVTKDQHETEAYARYICQMLLRDYGSKTKTCSIRGQCLETWVEDSEGNRIEDNLRF